MKAIDPRKKNLDSGDFSVQQTQLKFGKFWRRA
jgi:hypothetical protein